MVRIILADDDDNKAAQLQSFIENGWPTAEVVRTRSLQTTLTNAISGAFHLVLLDMTMPTFDISEGDSGGRPQPLAGREVLRQIVRRNVPIAVVIVTQFPRFGQGAEARTLAQVDGELAERFAKVYRGAIYYEAASESWKADLAGVIDMVSSEGAL